jgi:hypothetical protein
VQEDGLNRSRWEAWRAIKSDLKRLQVTVEINLVVFDLVVTFQIILTTTKSSRYSSLANKTKPVQYQKI